MTRIVLAALLVSACAPVTPLPGMPSGRCETARLGDLIGRPATPALVDRVRHRSGASTARVLRPGQILTMEYREGRLNVNVDRQNRVERFTCG